MLLVGLKVECGYFVIGLKSNLNHLFIIEQNLTTKLGVVKVTTLLNKINITIYFEKLTISFNKQKKS